MFFRVHALALICKRYRQFLCCTAARQSCMQQIYRSLSMHPSPKSCNKERSSAHATCVVNHTRHASFLFTLTIMSQFQHPPLGRKLFSDTKRKALNIFTACSCSQHSAAYAIRSSCRVTAALQCSPRSSRLSSVLRLRRSGGLRSTRPHAGTSAVAHTQLHPLVFDPRAIAALSWCTLARSFKRAASAALPPCRCTSSR
eukprot:3262782-Pleurochrysis_carterae.AAC.1